MPSIPIILLKFWIKAFIPGHIPGYTVTVPAGPHRGKTMIPGPGAINFETTVRDAPATELDFMKGLSGLPHQSRDVRFRMPAVGVSDCYLTDQREFSNDLAAKSRMHSEFTFRRAGAQWTFTDHHRCDPTVEVDCEDGDVECGPKEGDTDRMHFNLRQRSPTLLVEMDCAANNPCSPSSRWFGDIDYEGTITVDPIGRTLVLDAVIDQFPAFEAYVSVNSAPGQVVFHAPPPPGNTVRNLPRDANRTVKVIMEDTTGDGRFDRRRVVPQP